MGTSSDRWIADVASFTRNGFGNSAPVVTEADVARVRKATAGRAAAWTVEALENALPQPLIPDASWRATASHNSAAAAAAFDFTRWSTDAPQQAGMWFQIELPGLFTLTEIQFDSQMIPGAQGGAATSTAPRSYRVELSDDGRNWREPIAEGRGGRRTTIIPLAPRSARLVRITQTADDAGAVPWTMERLRVYQAAGAAAGASK